MKKVFIKNLFQILSTFGAMMIFESVLLGMVLICPPTRVEVRIILLSLMAGLVLLFFAAGFYWIFQTVFFDESGIHIMLFKRSLRDVKWENVESVGKSNRFRNPEIEIKVKDEKPLHLDDRKSISRVIDFYHCDSDE